MQGAYVSVIEGGTVHENGFNAVILDAFSKMSPMTLRARLIDTFTLHEFCQQSF